MRNTIYWIHLTIGLVTVIVVLMMSVTGVLLAFQPQIIAAFETYKLNPRDAASAPLGLVQLLRNVQGAAPATPTNVTVRNDPGAPVEVQLGRESTVYVDPYSGATLGASNQNVRSLFRSIENWHRWLALQGAGRDTGRAITGAANLLFLFLVMTGPILWLPKAWTWNRVKPVLLFRPEAKGRGREFNWHNVFGIWAAVPLLIIVISGVVASYPWANALLFRIAGTPPQAAGRPNGPPGGRGGERAAGGGGGRGVERANLALDGMNEAWATAHQFAERVSRETNSSWRAISWRPGPGPYVFTIDRGGAGQPQLRGTLTVDRATAQVVRWASFEDSPTGQRWRGILRFAHTGEVLGLGGQIVAALASFAAVMLGWTGIALAIRRYSRWRSRRQEAPKETAKAA